MSAPRLRRALESLSGQRVVVLGDLMADEYIFGRPERVSREAPVLIVRYESEALVPGGAANAARNVVALGARVALLGVVGDDVLGRRLRELFAEMGCEVEGIVVEPARPTTAKMRVLAGEPGHRKQHVLRLDRYADPPLGAAAARQLRKHLEASLHGADLLLISDYAYGVLTPALARAALAAAHARGTPVLVDSQGDLSWFRGAEAMTPNLGEAERAHGRKLAGPAELEAAGERLRRRLRLHSLLITRGAGGMSLFEQGSKPWHQEVASRAEVVDVTGAGDTVAATFGLALSAGVPARDAAILANLAAGLVVQRSGAAAVTLAELRKLLPQDAGPAGVLATTGAATRKQVPHR